MLRGGYMKYVANGIFSSYMPLRRITRKIEQIIREEMDTIDGQEVQFPVVLPATLWEESGRYESVGSELLRFTDRNNCLLYTSECSRSGKITSQWFFASTYFLKSQVTVMLPSRHTKSSICLCRWEGNIILSV